MGVESMQRPLTPDMLIAEEETFGPVAGCFRFTTEEEAIAAANEALRSAQAAVEAKHRLSENEATTVELPFIAGDSVSLPLTAGRYEYAFVVDGKRWIADPSLPTAHDEFGGEHSVLRLGAAHVM